VIQQHAATRNHFDFRLELDGTFKSWAVPREPSLNPLDNRLAVQVEDHPLEYGGFEGIIPPGNYGAGTVMIWDRGTYEERGQGGRQADEEALRRGLERGKLTLLLNGEKLKGEFALVRLRRKNESRPAWLLIKKRDAWARFTQQTSDPHSVVSHRTLDEIARAAEKEGKIWIPGRGPVRRVNRPAATARAVKRRGPASPAAARMPRRVRAQQAVIASRAPDKGDWWYERAAEHGVRAIAEIEPGRVQLYSRAFLPLNTKFPQVVAALRKVKHPAVLDGEILATAEGAPRYRVQDVLYWRAEDLRGQPFTDRRRRLERLPLTGAGLEIARVETDLTAVPLAGDGDSPWVIARRGESRYSGGISRDWVRFRHPTRSGSARAAPAPAAAAPREKPRASRRPASPARATLSIRSPDHPPLTNVGKVFWPDEGITKGDLLAYYEKVSSTLIPHLIDRPQSLHRQPDGIRTSGFFQKDMAGYFPRRIATQRVYSRSSEKTIQYVLCQDTWTLLYLVNLGCIELNPWLSRIVSLDSPDLLVIDLDPDGNPFEEVVAVALEVRRVLQLAGVESWCKTSGASGLHICAPTGTRYPYDDIRLFAQRVCEIVQRRLPGVTSTERTPAKRRGKIYLDFLQNRRGQTLAAPYCVRPMPGATVSTPLRWSEVRRGLDPREFTIATTPRRLARVGDLWTPVTRGRLDLRRAQAKLGSELD
jgi:bifunctional non-homologous end joining protein LigD